MLSLKQLTPVRLIRNGFYDQIHQAEEWCSKEQLRRLLGHGLTKLLMYKGILEEGELEIRQVSTLVNKIEPVAAILSEIWVGFRTALDNPLG